MQYVMLIYQGDTPYPGSEAWAALSEAEQKASYEEAAAGYGAIGATPA
jgi:hypothetical protein